MLFTYKALNPDGDDVIGTIEAESRLEAFQELKNVNRFTAIYHLKKVVDNPFLNAIRDYIQKPKKTKGEVKHGITESGGKVVEKVVYVDDPYANVVQMFKEDKPTLGQGQQHQRDKPEERSIDWDRLDVEKKKNKKVKDDEVMLFTKRLAMMTNSGLTLFKSLRLLEETASENFSVVIVSVLDDIQDGNSFSESIARYPTLFDTTYVSMAQIGETSGSFGQCLYDIVAHQERMRKIKKRVKTATVYPTVMGVFMLIFMTAGSIFLLPRFKDIFTEQGMELPAVTLLVFKLSDIVPFVIIGGGLAVAALLFARKRSRTLDRSMSVMTSKFLLRIPIARDVVRTFNMHAFSSTTALMLKNGLRINDILKLTARVIKNTVIQDGVLDALDRVVTGIPLSDAIEEQPCFDRILSSIIMTGEEAGNLTESLTEISKYYEEELDAKVMGLLEMMQPIFVLVIAAVVIPVVIAIYLPLISMSSGQLM